MKAIFIIRSFGVALIVLNPLCTGYAQGRITFNDPWVDNGIGYFSLRQFDGMSFRANPYPPQPHDDMRHIGASGPAGYPHNGTPYVGFINTLGIPQSVVFAWTNAASLGQSFLNGTPFGLVSVDLADPVAPSLTPVAITFNGFKTDGSMVSTTFITPGNGATTFQTYQFGPGFALGLARVEIPSPFWAMDNIVVVPEPSTWAFWLIGGVLGAYGWVRNRNRSSDRPG